LRPTHGSDLESFYFVISKTNLIACKTTWEIWRAYYWFCTGLSKPSSEDVHYVFGQVTIM